jgi:hypothetical protein
MKKDKFKHRFHSLLAIIPFFLIISCASTPDVVGKWREIGKTGTLEFWKDGTFKAVDSMGMAVSGKYTLHKNGSVTFEIHHKEPPPEIIKGSLSIQGDELTFTSAPGKEVERYEREKR